MSSKNGFTIVELLAVITILVILLLLVIPNVSNVADKSNITLKESKIRTIETVGEKYGNAAINNYKNCVNAASSTELKNSCSVSVSELVMRGYIDAEDDDYNVLDPSTKKPFDGRVLMCYNPASVSIEATYVDDDSKYSCSAVELETGAALNLSSVSGKGYVGGDPIEINIIKSGIANGSFSCVSNNPDLATCDASSSTKLIINVTDQHFTDFSKEVKITLFAEAKNEKLSQTYTLIIYNTELKIDRDDDDNVCLEHGKSQQYGLLSQNAGELSVESSDEGVLIGDINGTTLTAMGGTAPGKASLTIKEANGKQEAELEKRIYYLESEEQIPSDFLLGNTKTIKLNYGGNDSVNIKSSDANIIKVSSSKNKASGSINLTGEETFTIHVVGTGEATLTLTGNPCGKIEKTIKVTNLYVKDNEAKIYVGGKSFKTEIVGAGTFSCVSSDDGVAGCSVSGSTVTVTPGVNAGLATITVNGSNGGQDTIGIETIKTMLSLQDQEENEVSHICSSVESPDNDSRAIIKYQNIGTLSISSISDANLAVADIFDEELLPHKRALTESIGGEYKVGYNTGIVHFDLQESNGRITVPLDYYIYNIKIPQSPYDVIAGERTAIEIVNYASGPLTATSSDSSVAAVTIDNPGTYSYDLNAENKSRLIVDAIKTGKTIVTIKGSRCGEVKLELNVIGKTFTIETKKGTYTDFIGDKDASELTCSTTGDASSCEVVFPDFKVKNGFEVLGFSTTKDGLTVSYRPGDKLVLTEDNDGTEFFANAIVNKDPVCSFRKPLTSVNAGETNTVTMLCTDPSESHSILTKESFIISNPDAAEIVSVDGPIEVVDEFGREGYNYKIEIIGKEFGSSFDFDLKEGEFIDQFDKKNAQMSVKSVLVGKYNSFKFWYVGKENPQDAIAVLYINKDLPEGMAVGNDEYYTLMLYGTGATKDYNTGSDGDIPPWIPPGYQEYITGVIINEGITEIGNAIFYALYNLENIIIPEGVTRIGESSFSYAKKVKHIDIPSTVLEIEDKAFEMCTSLETLNLNDGLLNIGASSFKNHLLSEIIIPNTVQDIGNYAFFSDIDGEQDVSETAKGRRLRKIEFEENSQLQFIGIASFKNNKVNSLNIPASLILIGDDAFSQYDYDDDNLKYLTFDPDAKIKNIASYAFAYNCIENLTLPDSLEIIANFAFDGIRATTLKLGPKVSQLGANFSLGNNMREYTVDETNDWFTSLDGILYTKDMMTLYKMPVDYYSFHTELNVPSTVTTIADGAFSGWIKYETSKREFVLNLSNNITEMNIKSNFLGNIISEFNIDSSEYTSENGVLFNKDKTVIYRLPTHYGQTTYTIPDSVTTVADSFAYANFTVEDIYIPNSVKTIEAYALAADPHDALKNIHLGVDDDVIIDENALVTFLASEDDNYLKNVYVKSDAMITRLRNLYSSNLSEFNFVLEDQ